MTVEHRDLSGASLHNSKVLTFTGDPATYVPPEAGIFVVCLTPPNDGKLYRTTGTTAGAVALLATGQDGAAATISIGDVTTLPSDSEALVTNVGTATNAIFDFELPTGPKGDTGDPANNLLPPQFKEFTTGEYTLALADLEQGLVFSGSDAGTVFIPTEASVAFPVGTQIMVGRRGTGLVTIEAVSGVLLNGIDGNSMILSDQWGVASLWKIATNEWWIFGGVS